ncbi:uncharacterized protein LOC6039088 [Culex quinquefasciatus]|uniref:uncharacterized protein LOC6039088 n=1 Tax=Culex quinquefasciatus TaxID=7176 RepID=UPI0018E2FF7D|nr:uncharacterized protein LOC6039088 [Culex quinquefasciatus]XP_038122665.1 uncharacterized protein LOC6039088 [Culex quinquefasciatus]
MSPAIVILFTVAAIVPVSSVQTMLDSFSYCNSSGMVECSARVRKVNRTTAALYGKFVLNTDIDSSFNGAVEVHHSPLGNNQFNRYPMKIGPVGFCEFLNDFWGDYYDSIVPYMPNIMKPRECPVSPRTIPINDWIMDPKMLPKYVPTGLWKVITMLKSEQKKQFYVMELIFKVYDDGYF